jgi:hypothetical protein
MTDLIFSIAITWAAFAFGGICLGVVAILYCIMVNSGDGQSPSGERK